MNSSLGSIYQPSEYRIDDSFAYLIRRILVLTRTTLDARLRQAGGPTGTQWRLLHYLFLRGPLQVAELARLCETDPAGMTRMLDRLVRQGLCQRLRAPADRRVVNVMLTERGRESAKRLAPELQQIQAELLRGFDDSEVGELRGFLERILDNGQTLGGDPG
ncbi:MarR family winged helix-turn-helix transcriptional regulator [Variovorax sp. YR216]|uniref:MarR family winged helix-turn-helix transcriptional regulator n=1 Tax=Variovorax sp. YR216 TaxID=1882828 RepID=UPI000899F75A|nr:MarR family transcriptional regulator [Variovorax sp. YR216]SEB25088.1 DNA-binding transcriptional regulator, MarR family [Variovorax sp. YR216]